ncbi:MAG: polysaccharide deacetylase family protein [Candidatus Komeilibacteria bacterium]|nr:polysaccharide deacetylase family protein [Candidatus Komeilibacteria bacterium]
MSKLLKNLLFFGLNLFFINKQSGPSILMYHSVGHNQAFFTVKPKIFEKQLAYLKNKGFKIVFLSELIRLLKEKQDCSKIVVLTFDDGYLDNYEIVLPLLKKYQLPATIFLITGLLGSNWANSENISLPLLREPEIKEIILSGLVEFMPQNIFAYPKGRSNQQAIDIIRKNGFIAAVTTTEGLVNLNNYNLYQLPRNAVNSKTSRAQFIGKLSNSIDYYLKLKNFFGRK